MNQTTIFDVLYPKYKIIKPIRLIELFAGYGSQYLALKYLGANVKHYKICEWATKSIQAYNDLHIQDYFDYSGNLSDDNILKVLIELGVSINYNEPATKEQLKRQNFRKIYNNIIATNNLVNIQNAKGEDFKIVDKDQYDYIMTYSFPCVTKNTLVLSEKGYIPFEKLNIGNKVLTKSNTWQRVVKQFDNGVHDIYMLNAYGTAGIECTKEHKFYAREMYRKGHKYIRCFKEPKMIHAKDLTTKHYLGIPIIKDEIPFYSKDLDFWYMIGYYLGDGWLSSKGNDIILACNDKKLNKLKENLDINKWKYTYNFGKTCYRFRFSNKIIYDFIKKYIDTGSENKHIPIEILNLPKKQLMSLYKGYLDSDGCIINEKHQFSTTNENMAYSFVSIIHKLFKRPASIYKIKVNPKKEIQGRIVNQKDWYQIRFKLTKNKQDKAFYENDYIWFPFKSLTYLRKDNVYNMEIENDHSYIINGLVSANCQDLSLAGKGKGMADTSTRSGMLWEVERILNELKTTNSLPQILLMENVPQVHGSDNVEHFNKWQLALERLGYKSYFQDLIATDYGIPQTRNRCFMVSILGDYSYSFPNPIPLKLKLKDMLEDEVDEKYYLSDRQIKDIQNWNAYEKPLENMEKIDKADISPTLTTRSGAYAAGMILVKNATKKGYLEATAGDGIDISSRMEHHRGTVQKDKIQTLTTSGGNDRGVVISNNLKKDLCNKLIKENKVQEYDIIKHSYTNQILKGNKKCVEKNDGNMITLTTRGDCYGVCVGTYQYAKSDKFMNGKDRLQLGKDVSDTLQTTPKEGICYNDLRIRKLTPREAGRLMCVKDEDIDKLLKNQSNSSAYHLFGDSIIVSILMAIFGELLDVNWIEKFKEIENKFIDK